MFVALLGALAAFVAVSSLLLWFAGARSVPGEARLKQLTPSRRMIADAGFGERIVTPVLGGFLQFVIELLPHTFVARIGRQLVTAGRPLSSQTFFLVVIVAATLLPGALLIASMSAGNGSVSALVLGMIGVMFAAGLLLPFAWLRRRVRTRKMIIWKGLADAFDLVTVSVEAGLGLDAALRHVSEKLHGPLADEIRQMLREVGMGRPRREALEEMAQRIDVREVETFVNAVIQAEQLGTSLGRVLRAQSATLRVRRRQRAEEIARKAPVKMVFPLVFCLMPAFFIVVLGPIFVRLVNHLGE
jgi:tight adherence protein C